MSEFSTLVNEANADPFREKIKRKNKTSVNLDMKIFLNELIFCQRGKSQFTFVIPVKILVNYFFKKNIFL